MNARAYSVVVPTVGRPELQTLLTALSAARGPLPDQVVVVDDRREADGPLPRAVPAVFNGRLRVVRGAARGPAAARNLGWRATSGEWVAFLDDDVVPSPTWRADLQADLAALPDHVGGSQGRVSVPLPSDRRPTDWERNTAGLANSVWITADMAYRRAALERVGGFDERFRRAYREDADLALRVMGSGFDLVRGSRVVRHPVRPAQRWASLRAQAGNADDALMQKLHSRNWRVLAHAPRGRFPAHVTATTLFAVTVLSSVARWRSAAAIAGAAWAASTAELAWARIGPGPRSRDEIATMLMTSALIPPVATYHRLAGLVRHRGVRQWTGRPQAVLFDRDGTLIEDVPYNGDPGRVRPVPGARAALERLRAAGVRIGVVTNQSGIGRGLVSATEVDRVNRRVEELLGSFDFWELCPHTPDDGCACRKPGTAMIRRAANRLGVPVHQLALVGDIGTDVEAGRAAGVRAVLVPTALTRPEEVAAAPEVHRDLAGAVDALLGRRPTAGDGR